MKDLKTTKLKSKKKRTNSQRQWLLRQLNDPYVEKAKKSGYRSRAAFKILQIHEKYKLVKPGQVVVDLGAAPGGWTQIISNLVQSNGKVFALDMLPMTDFSEANVETIIGDFTDDAVLKALQEKVTGKVDVVLTDMAAPACGIPSVDHLRIVNLIELSLDFAFKNLAKGGHFVGKVLQGGTEQDILKACKLHFKSVHHFKPDASRKDSAEMYLICLGFRA